MQCYNCLHNKILKKKDSWAMVEGDNAILDPCYKPDFSYDCYAKHTAGLLKLFSTM